MKEELRIEITAEVSDAVKNVNKAKEEVKEFGVGSKEASAAADEAFAALGDATKKSMLVVTGAIAAGAAALVGLAESTREYRDAQAKLNTAFETAGSNAEVANQVYTELVGTLGESDVAVEAANHLAKLTTNQEELAQWTDICTGVYATFGDSLPIENLTEAANETAKTGALTGGLADALNWAGIHEDEFQAALDECSNEQERQQLITKTLTKEYKNASEQFKKTNKDIIASNKATEKWNAAMAKMGGYVEPVMTDVRELGASLLEDLQEPIKDICSWITGSFIPALKSIISWVKDNQPIIIAAASAIAAGFVTMKLAAYNAKLATEGLTIATVAQTAAQKVLNAVMNANPYTLALTAIVALTAGIIAYAVSIEETSPIVEVLTEEEKALIEESNKAAESFREQKKAIEESAGDVQAQAEYTKKLADELLKLADSSGKVKEEDEARANFIINELNEAYDTEFEMVDGVIQQYSSLKDKIYEVIQAKTAQSLLELNNQAYVDAISNEGKALSAVSAAYKDLQGANEQYATRSAEIAAEIEKLEQQKADALKQGSQFSTVSIDANIAKLNAELGELEKNKNEKQKIYNEAAANYGEYTTTINNYEAAQAAVLSGNYEEAIDILAKKGASYGDYADDVDAATAEVLDTLYKEAIDTGIEAQRIKNNFEKGVKGYTKEMVEEAEKAHTDAMGAWEDAYNEAYGIGGDMGDGLKKGLEDRKMGLIDKAKNIISTIWNAMRKEADSHSPSRKTMKLGGDIGAGLQIGIDKSTDDVVKSAKSMVKDALIPIKATIDTASFKNLSGIFSASSIGFSLPNLSALNRQTEAAQEPEANNNTKPTILQLVVDKKVLGEVSVSSINDITRMTGNLPLVIA